VTTMREPTGTSFWPSIGYVNTTPGRAVARGSVEFPQATNRRHEARRTNRCTARPHYSY
jgi:hypothetical protein